MNRRDIELLISARETTGRSFKAVVDNINALNAKIDEQVRAAERGEGSLQDLRRSQDELAQAGRDLSALQGQIDAYRRLEEQHGKNIARSEALQQEMVDLIAQMGAAETLTAAQERRLASWEKKQQTASAAVEQTTTDLKLQSEALERAGIDVNRLDQAQTQIVNTARQAGAGFTQLGISVDSYADNVRRARDAEQALAAQNTFDQKIAQARQLGDASRFVQLFAQATQTLAVGDNQLAALTGFRAVGAMASEAAQDVSRFVQAGQAMPIATSNIAAGLRAIVDPGNEALRTIGGVEAAIEQASAAINAEKQTVAGYSNALNEISAASAALVSQGALIDTFERQAAATALARQQFEQAQAEVVRLGTAMQAADAPTEGLVQDLARAEIQLQQTGRALAAEETKLGQLSRSLEAAGIDTNNLAAAQGRLEVAANSAGAAMGRANSVLGRGGARPGGLFGLNPYELQNLSFQLNDVVVGLVSGQRPLTVLAQQGLQISQLFPGLISGIARFTLRWFPLIAVITTAIGVMATWYAEAQRLKQAQRDLATLPTGDGLNAQQFANAQKRLETLGASAADAREAMLALAEEGFDQTELNAYSEAAGRLAQRLGIEVPEAAELLVNVQRGGIEAVFELTERTNDLTDADLAHAEALFEAGRAGEARQFVLDRVAERNAEIARNTQSVWTPAVNNLKSAWQSFTGWLQSVFRPVIDGINSYINETIIGFTYLTGLLAGRGNAGATADANAVIARQRGANRPVRRGATDQQVRDRRFANELDEELDTTRDLTRAERLRRAEVQARTRAQAAGVSQGLEDRAVQQAIASETRKINQEAERAGRRGAAAGRRAEAARRRAARQAETAARRIESAQNTLEGQLRQLDSATGRGRSATLEERLRIVDNRYQSIFDSIQRLRSLGVSETSDGVSLETTEEIVRASQERLRNEERIKYFEDQIDLLTAQRRDEIENIANAQERGARTVAEAYRDAEAVNGRISPQIVQAARNALEVARGIAGATPSPEMVSMIARLERIIAGEGVTDIVNRVGVEAMEGQEQRLNNLLRERQDLVESINTLNELGLIGDAEARERTAAAYVAQAGAIRPVLAQLRETVELLHQQRDALTGLPLISDAAYAAWQARLQAIEAGLENVDARMMQVQEAARTGVAQGITNAFKTVSDTIVGLVAGTLSWGDALSSVINTGLSLLGSFLQAIADVLVQMVALQIAKSLISVGSGGFGGFLFHGGGQVGALGGRKRTNIRGDWFGAPKFHGGGGLGLRRDEYKAVLKRGEEVLTEDNPRHINNVGSGGPQGPAAPNLKQVLVLDPEEIPRAMQSKSGQRTLLTFIRTHKETIKQVLK